MSKKKKEEIINNYDSSDIEILEGREAVRERPGMYIGGKGPKALHHLVYEVVTNSVDEALAGNCDTIEVTIEKDESITIEDNGRGIPVSEHPKYKRSALEIIFTVLHSGGKFKGGGYKVSGGLHGVGLSVVNFLSTFVEVTVNRDGKEWFYRLEEGVPKGDVIPVKDSEKTGTKIRFLPDAQIFDTTIFSYETISLMLKELALLNKGLNITLKDKRGKNVKEENFNFLGGIEDYVKEINKTRSPLHKEVIYIEGLKDDVSLEIAMQYTDEYSENIYSFANNIKTGDGGTHELGFKLALSRVINDVARKKKILKDKEDNLSGDDIREGLVAIVSVKLPNPSFEGQVKGKLTNTEIRGIVDSIATEKLTNYFLDYPNILSSIVKKATDAAKAREMVKKAKEVSKKKSNLEVEGLSGKIASCTTKNPEEAEVYIVEGDSAGGSAKQGRNRYFQAILPLRGKIINTEKAKLSKILSNKEIRAMITAFGTGIGKEFMLENLKYHKIVIMTDADVDGEHIRTLLLTFFYRFLKPLIDHGYIYIAKPPLYKISKGKEVRYAFSDNEKNNIIKELGENVSIQRYKGLGEMNPTQLWETTMDPETRVLIKVTEEDAILSDKIFTTLMSESVEERRDFIQRHAKYANIDA